MLLEMIVLVTLVLANGLFAGAEIAIVGIERFRLSQLAEEGGRRPRAVHALRANLERFFATVQIVITVVGTAAGAFGGATFAGDLKPFLTPVFGAYAGEVAIGLVVTLVSYLSLVLGEPVPKSLGLRHAEPYALFVAPLLLWLSSIARPVVWFLTASSNIVLKGFGDKATFSETRLSPEELRNLVEEAAESGRMSLVVARIHRPHAEAPATAAHRESLLHVRSRLPIFESRWGGRA
jgi:putative hemolysin